MLDAVIKLAVHCERLYVIFLSLFVLFVVEYCFELILLLYYNSHQNIVFVVIPS